MKDWKSRTDAVEFEARAAASAYIVMGLCLGAPAICSSAVITARPELFASWAPVLVGGLGVLAFTAAWLRAFHVRLNQGRITYNTLFSGSIEVPLVHIEGAKFVRRYDPWADWGKPHVRLDLYEDNSNAPTLSINLKVLGRRDVRFLLSYFSV
jgi:hypothetical protein